MSSISPRLIPGGLLRRPQPVAPVMPSLGTWLVAATIALSVTPARAEERELYTVDWHIAAVTDLAEPAWVGPYTSFVQGKMLAKARYVLAGDAVTANGTRVADSGTLIVATNFSQSLGCALTLPGESLVLPVDSKKNIALGCLLDSDGDGRFDKFFQRGLFIGDFTWNQSALPRKLEPISPVAYRLEQGPGAMAGIPIYLQYSWFASGVDQLIFQVCNRPNLRSGLGCLAPVIRVKQSSSARVFEALGGRFEVIAKIDNRIQVRQLAPIGNSTLSVRRR